MTRIVLPVCTCCVPAPPPARAIVNALAFSSKYGKLISSSEDSAVGVWTVGTERKEVAARAHTHAHRPNLQMSLLCYSLRLDPGVGSEQRV